MKKIYKTTLGYLTISLAFVIGGCSTPKKVEYFQDLTQETVKISEPRPITIEPNDKLTIMVKTMDPTLSALFNLVVMTDRMAENTTLNTGNGTLRSSTSSAAGVSRYTVSPDGYIDFPVLGNIKVAGMTRNELAAFIKGELMGKDLAKDPVITVEFVNMGVSLLGEVARPGRYDINQDQINLLEAISMAGDLTLHGKRDNVTILREENGELKTYRVDLTNYKELSESPAFYLKQGDLIYVAPSDMRKRQTTTNGNSVYTTGFWISLASLLTSVVTTIAVFVR